jgi:hypothetical protein
MRGGRSRPGVWSPRTTEKLSRRLRRFRSSICLGLTSDDGFADPEILRNVAQAHEALAGVYCAVLVEGVLSVEDSGRGRAPASP